MPSPDPSTQIAPDPAPSGGEFGSHGAGGQIPQHHTSTPTTPTAGSSNPAAAGQSAPAPTGSTSKGRAGATVRRKARRDHAAATHRRARQAISRRQVRVEAAQRRPATFASSLALALRVPVPAPVATVGHRFDDVFLLASIALLLFVMGGLMVVRSSAQVMRQERPA